MSNIDNYIFPKVCYKTLNIISTIFVYPDASSYNFHDSICDALSGNYITHLTVDPSQREEGVKAADQLATFVFQWLCENQLDETIQAIGGEYWI